MVDLALQLAQLSTSTSYPKNTEIIKEGDTENLSMYIILQGEVDVVKNYGSSDQVLLTRLSAGDFFGEMSLFLSKPRNASVIAAENVILLEITQENVSDFIKNNPELLYGITRTLCARIDDMNEKVPDKFLVGSAALNRSNNTL